METKSNPGLKERLFNFMPLLSFIGLIAGAIGGYIYYIEIGCNSGTCPLTSNPYLSILWGAVIGYLFGDLFKKKPKPAVKSEE